MADMATTPTRGQAEAWRPWRAYAALRDMALIACEGIWLFGKGCPVAGSMSWRPRLEKSPCRSAAGTLSVLLLATTTPMADLLGWARRRGLPGPLVEIASLMYRILFVLLDVALAMRAAQVARLEGGVYVNAGSAVILPEVFLKALSTARNLGHDVRDFTTVDLDMNRHYRPHENVLKRPVLSGGASYAITGHHELILPLLAQALVLGLEEGK